MTASDNATPFWVVWNEDGAAPMFKHGDRDSAEKEAERLARLNAGQTFHVLGLVGSCRRSDLQWFWTPGEMPF